MTGYEPGRDIGLRSSFQSDEVTFLLTDLSGVALERGLEERERRIQGGENYAAMLPIEYAPTDEYLALFERLLRSSAATVAEEVGVVTELALSERRGHPVLVSLARAGTPVGILMRRWAAIVHQIAIPHYSISIVRGRGIDTVALDYILERHDAADVLFVDGWTGKGAITTELTEALADYAQSRRPELSNELAVLADPGGCSTIFGTREDIVVPSACLNATVCGLVSRTVLNDELIGPGMFHGAKVYSELAAADRSAAFLNGVSDQFPVVRAAVEQRSSNKLAMDRTVTFGGLEIVRRLQEELSLPSWHLVKPGIGETTRVLLRRLPQQILVRSTSLPELEHVYLLANDRGVPIVTYPDMPYRCIGIVQPVGSADG